MSKKLLYFMMVLATLLSIQSCKDEDLVEATSEREFMTMFRTNDNTGKGGYPDDPYACHSDGNSIYLYWYGVNDCAGYEIRYGLQPNVSAGGDEVWADDSRIEGSLTVGPDVLSTVIPHLQYSTNYYFSIRVLSKKGEAYHSKWYGHGSSRQWSEYTSVATQDRYQIPLVIQQRNLTKNSVRIYLFPSYLESGEDTTAVGKDYGYARNFEVENDNFVMNYLTVEASRINPNAAVPSEFSRYALTQADFDRGYVDITGLSKNSVYNINVLNDKIEKEKCFWDAIYNTETIRTDGDPEDIKDTLIVWSADTLAADTLKGAHDFNAMRLDYIIEKYNVNNDLAEGTTFNLEGGKAYYFTRSMTLCKGMTLRTNPEDVAKGKRAIVYLGGVHQNQPDAAPNTMNFIFGRNPQTGELGSINIKSLIFSDIDFDCPLARNNGDGGSTGNYFINMYSNGMAVNIQSFELHNCTIQRTIRGFIRIQGSKTKFFEKLIIDKCIFYNNGFFQGDGRAYNWIHGQGAQPRSNMFNDVVITNNTFYDNPKGSFFTNNNEYLEWPSDIKYNIRMENNTFVNFNTRGSNCFLFSIRYVPGGSHITVKKNLFILTKNDADDRPLNFVGADIRSVVFGDGSGVIHYDIADNYSTNTNIHSNTGDIFSNSAFSAKKNAPGAHPEWNVGGAEELIVKIGNDGGVSPLELMKDPNPPYFNGDKNMHETGWIDGSGVYITLPNNVSSDYLGDKNKLKGVDLHYNLTNKVLNSDIYKKGIGDTRWADPNFRVGK